jgi:hypothetical protein
MDAPGTNRMIAFGSRWAKRVKTPVLMRLMRHASIETTMGYYVDLNVDDMADDLWANHSATAAQKPGVSDISGNIRPSDAPALTEWVGANHNNKKTSDI